MVRPQVSTVGGWENQLIYPSTRPSVPMLACNTWLSLGSLVFSFQRGMSPALLAAEVQR